MGLESVFENCRCIGHTLLPERCERSGSGSEEWHTSILSIWATQTSTCALVYINLNLYNFLSNSYNLLALPARRRLPRTVWQLSLSISGELPLFFAKIRAKLSSWLSYLVNIWSPGLSQGAILNPAPADCCSPIVTRKLVCCRFANPTFRGSGWVCCPAVFLSLMEPLPLCTLLC